MASSKLGDLGAFRAFADTLPVLYWTQREGDRATWINAAMAAYVRRDDYAMPPPGTHPEDVERVRATLRAGVSAPCPFAFEMRMRPFGAEEYRWFTARVLPVRDGDRVVEWIGLALDVHESKSEELDARDIASVAHRYREIAENLPGLVWSATPEGVVQYVNPAWHATFGITGEEAVAGAILGIIHPDDAPRAVKSWSQAVRKRLPFEQTLRIRTVNGGFRTFFSHAVPLFDSAGGLNGFLGVNYDIQAQVDMSDERMSSLRRVLDTLPTIAWSANGEDATWFNGQWYDYTGLDERDSLVRGWTNALHPDDLVPMEDDNAAKHAHESTVEMEVRIRGADGQYRWHLTRRSPIYDSSGRVIAHIGTSTDIDRLKRVEEQLRFSAAVSDAFNFAQSPGALAQHVAELAVPAIADFVVIWLTDRRGAVAPGGAAHRSSDEADALREYIRSYPLDSTSMATHTTLRAVDDEVLAEWARDERQLGMLRRLRPASVIALPLEINNQRFGSMCLARTPDSPSYSQDDVRFVELLARRMASALENIRIYQRERNIADTFQRAALPKTLPSQPGLTLSAVYRAAEDEARVGGDWYDAFTLDDGRVVVAVGDVTGKGLEAAVTMATVRQNVRLAAYEGHDPAGILFTVDRALRRDTPDTLVTAFVGIIDRRSSRMTFANAGHPWPAIRHSDGQVTTLAGSEPPLGLLFERPVPRAVSVPTNALLFFYTDGLLEASRDVLEGERWLAEALQNDAVVHASDPAKYLFESLIPRAGGQRDDVAILAVSTGRSIHWSLNAEDAMAAQGARSSFVRILREEATADSDFYGAELIFGELIGNVVRHAPGEIDIALDWNGPQPVLHVLDRGLGFDTPNVSLPQDALSETSRGLYLVATLGSDFRIRRLPGRGTHASVRLPVRRG